MQELKGLRAPMALLAQLALLEQKVPPVPKVADPKLSTEAELAPDEDPEFDLDGKTLKKTAPAKTAAKTAEPTKTTKTF